MHLPSVIQNAVHLNSLELVPTSFITDQLKSSCVDLLYRANWKERGGFMYLLVEHQSTYDWEMPLRILKYMINIIDYHKKNSEIQELLYICKRL